MTKHPLLPPHTMDREIDNLATRISPRMVSQTNQLLPLLDSEKASEMRLEKNKNRQELRELLMSFDAQQLRKIITQLNLSLLPHPSSVLVAQLCLDLLGFHHSKVDGISGKKTQTAVSLLKSAYNTQFTRSMPCTGQIDSDCFMAMGALLDSGFVYTLSSKGEKTSNQEQKKPAPASSEIQVEKEGMITTRTHKPDDFMRDIGSGPLNPAYQGKIFYLGTKKRKDEHRKRVASKKHLFWHGSEGNSKSAVEALYKSGNAAYAILQNGAIVCFFDERKGTGALNGNKGKIFNDLKAHSNGIAVEFALPGIINKATFKNNKKTYRQSYRETIEPNDEQIQASRVLLDHLQLKNGPLNVGTSGAGRLVGSSTHTDTIGRSDETLKSLGVGQDYIDLMHTRVNPV